MGRKLKYEKIEGSTSSQRSAAWRARKREAAGLKPALTAAQKHKQTMDARRAQLSALKTQLVTRWGAARGVETFERLYGDESRRLGIEEQ